MEIHFGWIFMRLSGLQNDKGQVWQVLYEIKLNFKITQFK